MYIRLLVILCTPALCLWEHLVRANEMSVIKTFFTTH